MSPRFRAGAFPRLPLRRRNMRCHFCILCVFVLAFPAALRAAPASSGTSGNALTDARFAALDGDGNGRVTWEEFHTTNPSISRQGFDLMDLNKNGELSLEEWRAFTANHGMNISMPSSSVTVPARPLEPPAIPDAGEPSLPLIMPPAEPGGPADAAAEAGTSASPAAPARVEEPSLPLLMPPAASSGPAAPDVTSPAEPSPPAVPLITPPTPSEPDKGSSEVRRS